VVVFAQLELAYLGEGQIFDHFLGDAFLA